MSAATITSKGQTTIPADIRRGMGLQPGDQIEFHLLTDGSATMRAKRGTLKDFIGVLHKDGRPAVGVKEMDERIANTLRKKHRGKRK
jgi:AbrB family looped-hinge helix DNA binding protein